MLVIWETIIALGAHIKNSPPRHYLSVARETSGTGHSQQRFFNDQVPGDALLVIDFTGDITRAITGEHGQSEASRNTLFLTASRPFHVSYATDIGGHRLATAEMHELMEYLPYAILPYFAGKLKKCFSISHFAQTLDGRIAATSGESRWIGNAENLMHAHKMRALCDAILIGANTQRLDQPSLNVRHVNGNNPIRVILGGTNSLQPQEGESNNKLIHLSREKLSEIDSSGRVGNNSYQNCDSILSYLYSVNICSVYIEGGATTTSSFIQSRALDQIQVHISSKVLGSGQTGFDFIGVSEMQGAINFVEPRFVPMGDQVMFVGETARVVDKES